MQGLTIECRVGIECASGDNQPVQTLHIGLRQIRLVGQPHRQAACVADGIEIVLPQGMIGPAGKILWATRLDIEGEADEGRACHEVDVSRVFRQTEGRRAG
ncbi:hypothetical protein ABO01nite_26370 [Asaia bogorensis NBRC 16594]|uniref:Uncharacterized protein n=1 Tax=Asaia bogorensis NBRC 16594 TaxID=1231624 RepID=A0AAN4R4K2_9PROT|nr:hypothetical protein ABO01nite_26370 [Asaia bogorensis NBRC 16594]